VRSFTGVLQTLSGPLVIGGCEGLEALFCAISFFLSLLALHRAHVCLSGPVPPPGHLWLVGLYSSLCNGIPFHLGKKEHPRGDLK